MIPVLATLIVGAALGVGIYFLNRSTKRTMSEAINRITTAADQLTQAAAALTADVANVKSLVGDLKGTVGTLGQTIHDLQEKLVAGQLDEAALSAAAEKLEAANQQLTTVDLALDEVAPPAPAAPAPAPGEQTIAESPIE